VFLICKVYSAEQMLDVCHPFQSVRGDSIVRRLIVNALLSMSSGVLMCLALLLG